MAFNRRNAKCKTQRQRTKRWIRSPWMRSKNRSQRQLPMNRFQRRTHQKRTRRPILGFGPRTPRRQSPRRILCHTVRIPKNPETRPIARGQFMNVAWTISSDGAPGTAHPARAGQRLRQSMLKTFLTVFLLVLSVQEHKNTNMARNHQRRSSSSHGDARCVISKALAARRLDSCARPLERQFFWSKL
jgi:hypothetical protein